MDSTYFTAQAQALYQLGARALRMGSGQREITPGSAETADSLDPSAMDIEHAGSPMVSLHIIFRCRRCIDYS